MNIQSSLSTVAPFLLLLGFGGCDSSQAGLKPTNVFLNATSLSQQCISSDPQALAVCGGYLVAVADSIEHYQAALPDAEAENFPLHTRACLPDNIAVNELIQTWNDWTRKNSNLLDNTAYSTALQVYSERWPCTSS